MQESPRARQAWADYVALGPERSLEKLLELYRSRPSAPTRQLTTLKQWSRHHHWQARLVEIASEEAAAAEERQRAYITAIMETGFGLPHERVKVLKQLAGVLLDELLGDGADSRLWVQEPKLLGQGEFAERVDIERFNKAEVEQFRGLLDDIAKETGGRVRRAEVSGPGGRPIAHEYALDLSQLTDDELETLELLAERAAGPAGDPA